MGRGTIISPKQDCCSAVLAALVSHLKFPELKIYTLHDIRHSIVPTLRRDSQKITLKSFTVQCTVQCAVKVVATREESRILIGNG